MTGRPRGAADLSRRVSPLPAGMLALLLFGAPLQAQDDHDTSSLTYMTLRELNGEIARREKDLKRYEAQLEQHQRESGALEAEVGRQEAALQAQQVEVRQFLKLLARLTRGGYLQLLRGARNWIDLVRRVELTRAGVSRKLAELEQHQNQLAELNQRRAELAARQDQQQALQQRMIKYREQLQLERERRRLRWGAHWRTLGRENGGPPLVSPQRGRSIEL